MQKFLSHTHTPSAKKTLIKSRLKFLSTILFFWWHHLIVQLALKNKPKHKDVQFLNFLPTPYDKPIIDVYSQKIGSFAVIFESFDQKLLLGISHNGRAT